MFRHSFFPYFRRRYVFFQWLEQTVSKPSSSGRAEYLQAEFLIESLELAQSQTDKIVKLITVDSGVEGLKEMVKDAFLDQARFIINHDILSKNPFCSVCLKTFHNRKDRNNHRKVIHTDAEDVQQFFCKLCEKSYMSRSALKYHIDISHKTKSPKVKCSVCDAPFGHKLSLKRHMKVHAQCTGPNCTKV